MFAAILLGLQKLVNSCPGAAAFNSPWLLFLKMESTPNRPGCLSSYQFGGAFLLENPFLVGFKRKPKGNRPVSAIWVLAENKIRRRGPLWHHCLQPCPIRGVGNVPMVTTYLDPQTPPFFFRLRTVFFSGSRAIKKGLLGVRVAFNHTPPLC